MKKRIKPALAVIGVIAAAVIIAVSASNKPERDFSASLDFYKRFYGEETAGGEITVNADEMKGKTILSDQKYVNVTKDSGAVFSVNGNGKYTLVLDYENFFNEECTFEMYINGNRVDETFLLERRWRNADNSENAQSLPAQEQVEGAYSAYVNTADYNGFTGYEFDLPKQKNTVEIKAVTGAFKLYRARFVPKKNVPSYEQYRSQNAKTDGKAETVIEAENPQYKTSSLALAQSSADVNSSPFSTEENYFNVISTETAGDTLRYSFAVEESGTYKITLLYSGEGSLPSYRTLLIDGTLPFGEVANYPFSGANSLRAETLNRDGVPFEFYLEKGEHTLDISARGVVAAEISKFLSPVNSALGDLYLNLKKLVGSTDDREREWDIDEYFPNIKDDLKGYIDSVQKAKQLTETLSGSNARSDVTAHFDTAIKNLNKFYDDPNSIPKNMDLIAQGTNSIVQSVSSAELLVKKSPLVIDRIFITPVGVKVGYKPKGMFSRFKAGVTEFVNSFKKTDRADGETVIWVNRALSNVNLMQVMADGDFTAKTGIKVKLSVLKDEGKLVLSAASGVNPDAIVGVSNWLPYELGLRDLIMPLNGFDGVTETLKSFAAGAMLPLAVDGNILGFPETQDANVLFYRTDILSSLGLDVPQTWRDVAQMLPVLQRNGMNFYLPTSSTAASKAISVTSPFIYQHGGDLFTDDAFGAIDSEQAIAGFKTLTDFYTLYGLPQQVANFSESFRSGTLPIGIGTMSMYSQLSVSAPEITGKWNIALSPGVENDGTVNRYQSAAATCCAVMKRSDKTDSAWQFIRWWLSDDTQAEYARRCAAVWGDDFIWASANIKAFGKSNLNFAHKQTIIEQWSFTHEVPRAPGWYMLERELSNAFNRVVLMGENVRLAIETAKETADAEIKRKLTEFGYIKNGQTVKPYKITRIEDIKKWQQQ